MNGWWNVLTGMRDSEPKEKPLFRDPYWNEQYKINEKTRRAIGYMQETIQLLSDRLARSENARSGKAE